MSKRASVFIVGQRLTDARLARDYSQGDLLARYLAHYHALDAAAQRDARKLDGPALSHIENSALGDMYSKVKIKTAELLGLALGVPPATLYETPPVPVAAPVLPAAPPPPNGGARLLGVQEDLEFVDLPYISALSRPAFVSAGGELSSFRSTYRRRVYPRGTPLMHYTSRLVFEIGDDSMEPYIHSGDEVVAHQLEEADWEGVQNCIVVVAHGQQLTVKKVVGNDLATRSTLTLRPYRDELAPLTVRRNEIRALYRVEEVVPRPFKARL